MYAYGKKEDFELLFKFYSKRGEEVHNTYTKVLCQDVDPDFRRKKKKKKR